MGECSCVVWWVQSPVFVSLSCVSVSLTMAVGQAWRRPRMKVYDYNQEFGGNYYQPMIQYINHKNIYGPFSREADVYLPHAAEVNRLNIQICVTMTSLLSNTTWTSSWWTHTKPRSRN